MSKLIAARTAQTVLEAEFSFNFDDTMVNASGVEVDFGKTNTAATAFVVVPLPVGATLVGGDVITETAFDAATYLVTVGDSAVANRYLASTDLKGAGRQALTLTGYVGDGENIRIGVTAADVCTAGRMTLRVLYTVAGRYSEVQVS